MKKRKNELFFIFLPNHIRLILLEAKIQEIRKVGCFCLRIETQLKQTLIG